MLIFSLWSLAGFLLGLVVVSFCEWVLHRYVMHRPLRWLRYPFQAHAVVHHHIFKGDASYHLKDEADMHTIPMAWWNGPVLIVLISLPNVLLAWATGVWALAAGGALGIGGYYCVYEYLHWCMHLPKARRVEKSRLFQKLNGHHILHHRYMHKNFNVVLPLADLCLGTLLRRSKVRFAQPMGPAVPDVQPRNRRLDQTTMPAPELTSEELADRSAA